MSVTKEGLEEVTVSMERWSTICDQLHWLACLEAAGVDNWEGISEAIRIRKESE